ncbi:hypothetical protein [Pseudomonas fluorescens]|uniref:Uncharacterized protein n=1 Tax=Pseudomonas fluorescens TaxID=294 RepID=A0A5E7CKN4_PSEFL|nr:hypothetical protein [Pseudomonas fluorescens]VVO05437.1 hypothetical protein PS710_03014 [Pseudomonas fluorescens]
MKLLFEGDRGKALCEHCQKVVTTTYVRRSVPFSDGHGEAKQILVGVCEVCDAVVAIPPQSTPAIKEARKQQLTSIEARLPAIYLDVLDAAMHSITKEAGVQIRKLFFSYYFRELAEQETKAATSLHRVHEVFTQSIAEQCDRRHLPPSHSMKRLSMKVNHYVADDFVVLLQVTHMTQTELLKSVISQIQQDVLEVRNPTVISDLQRLTRVAM